MPLPFSRKNRNSLDISQERASQYRPLMYAESSYAQSSYAPSLAESAAPTIDAPSLAQSTVPIVDAPLPADTKPKVYANRYYESATIITRTGIDYAPRKADETKTNQSEIEEVATDKELGFERPRTPPKGKRKYSEGRSFVATK